MKPLLVLQLPGAELGAATPLHWARFNPAGTLMQQGHCALDQLQWEVLDGFAGETLVLVPGELVLLTTVRIPARQLRQIKQALPYMVEELIADNIEEVHLALPRLELDQLGGQIPVAVVRHNFLIDWLDQLYQHGVRPDFLGPDSLALPWREHSRSLFFTPGEAGGRVIYRDGFCSGQALFQAQLPVLLESLAEAPAATLGAIPRCIVGAGSELANELPALAAEIQAALGGEIDVVVYDEPALEVLATAAVRQRDTMINLLQGGYRVQRDGEEAGYWRRGALAATAGLVLFALVTAASGLWFSWQANRTEERTVALYREMFPQERRVISPRKQMAAHLQGGGAPAQSLLPLLARAAGGLEGTGVEELRYRRERNQLQLQVRAPSLEALERIQQQLGSDGLAVEINSAAEQGGDTVGRLVIGGVR